MIRNINVKKIIFSFVGINVLSYLFLWIIPLNSKIENHEFNILINLLFVTLVLFTSVFSYLLYIGVFTRKKIIKTQMNLRQLKFNVKFVSLMSMVGIILLAFDRIYIRGIDYSAGARLARYAWLESSGGSVYSIVGNVFVPMGYLCLFFLIVHYSRLQKNEKRNLLICAIISIMGHAYLNGGRSNILIALIFCIIAYTLSNTEIRLKNIVARGGRRYLLVVLLGVIFVSNITLSSARLGNINMSELTTLGVDMLFGETTESFDTNSSLGNIYYLFIYIVAYMFHGQWTAQASYSLVNRTGNSTFFVFYSILSKFGLIERTTEPSIFSKMGIFISLPGSFYYDFGFIGLIIFSLFIGLILGHVFYLLQTSKKIDGFTLGYMSFVLFMVFTSPILPSYGLVYTNFIVFAFIILGVINRIKFNSKSSWVVCINEDD